MCVGEVIITYFLKYVIFLFILFLLQQNSQVME